ncbi:hypothetical protein Gorai_014804 [Gossypium raimondii]|uniref:DUF4283 domain-containing protein n=1 Tax=Gossypium raimondii TaxID=29730 RepID=A0A7J8P3Z3_GOSRA|nr:hypothetical protein [Gossypium raimondii]
METISLCEGDGDEVQSIENSSTKKVRLKEQRVDSDVGMVVDPTPNPSFSWKERLVGKGLIDSRNGSVVTRLGVEDNFDFVDGDITISIINGIPSIVFSKRVWINGILQRVEYEYFPMVCFSCGQYGFNVLTVVNGNEEGKGSEIDDLQKVSIKGKGVRDEARFRGNNQIFDLIWKRFGQVVLLGLGNKSGTVSSKGGSQVELGGLSLGESRVNPKAHDKDLAQVNELGFVNLVKLVGFGKTYRPAGAKDGQGVLANSREVQLGIKQNDATAIVFADFNKQPGESSSANDD